MSIRLQFLRETWAFLRTFTGRAGEIAIDTTNNRLVVHDGSTQGGFPTARADQVALAGRTPVADANYSALATDVTVAYTALTAARSVTLPAASTYPAGRVLTVLDETGACSATNTITVAAAGGDTVNGAASVTLAAPYSVVGAMSNGVGRWVLVDQKTTALQSLTRLGLGTTADATNPFSAKLNKALWTALTTGEGGTGDLRYTLNKQAAGNTLSLLFQSGFSGRAEIGLTGDDDLRLKVSADGGTWREALRVDRATGGIDLTAAEASVPIAATVDLGGLGALRVALTGSGTVTGFGTSPNRVRLLRFTGAATLTHNAASLVLPGGANLVTAAGDTALAVSDASGNWRVVDYARASGKPVTGPAAAEIGDASASGRSVLTGTAAQGATALGLGTGSVATFAGTGVSGPSGTSRSMRLQTNGLNRWDVGVDGSAETGANAGSDFYVNLFGDDGNYLSTPLVIRRTTGQTILLSLAVNGNLVGRDAVFNDGAGAGIGRLTVRCWGDVSKDWTVLNNNGNMSINGATNSYALTINKPLLCPSGVFLGHYTLATLPSGVAVGLFYCTNGRKIGEGSGAGTGVPVYYSNNNWRRFSDDQPVTA